MDAESRVMKDMFDKLVHTIQLSHGAIVEYWKKYTQAVDKCLGPPPSALFVLPLCSTWAVVLLNNYFIFRIDRHAYVVVELLDLLLHERKTLGAARYEASTKNRQTRVSELIYGLGDAFTKLKEWYGFEAQDFTADPNGLVRRHFPSFYALFSDAFSFCQIPLVSSDEGILDLRGRVLQLFYNTHQPLSSTGKSQMISKYAAMSSLPGLTSHFISDRLGEDLTVVLRQSLETVEGSSPAEQDSSKSEIYLKIGEITQGMARWTSSIKHLLASLEYKHHRSQIILIEQCVSLLIRDLYDAVHEMDFDSVKFLMAGYQMFIDIFEEIQQPTSEEIVSMLVSNMQVHLTETKNVLQTFGATLEVADANAMRQHIVKLNEKLDALVKPFADFVNEAHYRSAKFRDYLLAGNSPSSVVDVDYVCFSFPFPRLSRPSKASGSWRPAGGFLV